MPDTARRRWQAQPALRVVPVCDTMNHTQTVELETHGNPPPGEELFHLSDGVFAEVGDRSDQHGVGVSLGDYLFKVLQRARPARSDHRHADRLRNSPGHGDVVTGL